MIKGEIWLVNLSFSGGNEQSGKRPAIVVKETEANMVVVIPMTSNIQSLNFTHTIELRPSRENGLKEISIGLVFHIRALDKRRFVRKIGFIGSNKIKELNKYLIQIVGD